MEGRQEDSLWTAANARACARLTGYALPRCRLDERYPQRRLL